MIDCVIRNYYLNKEERRGPSWPTKFVICDANTTKTDNVQL